MNKRICMVGLACLFWGQVAYGQSLEESLTNAFHFDSNFTIVQYATEAARQNKIRATLSLGPELSLSYSSSDIENESTPAGGVTGLNAYETTTSSISVTQKIFNQGVTVGSYHLARLDYEIALARLVQAEAMMLSDTAKSHANLYRARTELVLRKKNVERLQKNLKIIQAQFRAGDATRLDVTRARAELENANASLLSTQADLQESKAKYFSRTGIKAQDLQKPEFALVLPETITQARQEMRLYHPEWKMAALTKEKAQKIKNLAPFILLPETDITASQSRADNALGIAGITERESITLNFNYKLKPLQSASSFKQVRVELLQAEAAEKAIRDRLEQQIIAVWGGLIAVSSQQKARLGSVKVSKLVLDSTEREFRAGARGLVDLLDAEEDLLDDELSLISTERALITLRFDLLAMIGKLNAEFLGLEVE